MRKERIFSVYIHFFGNPKEIKHDKVFVDALSNLRHMISCQSISVSEEVYSVVPNVDIKGGSKNEN